MARVAFQGATGAYSEAAALQLFSGSETMACDRFEDVFDAVTAGRASHGILPVENSIGGSIHRNYDLLLTHDLPIVGEVELLVAHCLLALPGVSLAGIRRVYSHPQGLAQCEHFLRTLPDVEIVATYDTAGSARMIRDEGLRDTAAVASARAGEVFGLESLCRDIQDFEDNITRFVVISKMPEPLGTPDKTTIAFALQNKPGALFGALSVFALREIDLTKLESRPIQGRPWEYLFFAELAVDRGSLVCGRAIVHLAESARWVKTLGTYAAAARVSAAAGSGRAPRTTAAPVAGPVPSACAPSPSRGPS
jgi:prephenate dehydratase